MARLLHAMSTAAFSPVIVAIRTGTRVCGRDQQSQFMATGPSSSSSPSLEKEKKTFQLLSRSLQRNNAAHLNTFFFCRQKRKKISSSRVERKCREIIQSRSDEPRPIPPAMHPPPLTTHADQLASFRCQTQQQQQQNERESDTAKGKIPKIRSGSLSTTQAL